MTRMIVYGCADRRCLSLELSFPSLFSFPEIGSTITVDDALLNISSKWVAPSICNDLDGNHAKSSSERTIMVELSQT